MGFYMFPADVRNLRCGMALDSAVLDTAIRACHAFQQAFTKQGQAGQASFANEGQVAVMVPLEHNRPPRASST